MDKLGKTLLLVVCLLFFLNTIILYSLVMNSRTQSESSAAARLPDKVVEEMKLANIAVNQDMQVINGSGKDMWVRVLVEIPEVEGKKVYHLESKNIYKNPTRLEKQSGAWVPASDGFYYYSKKVAPGEQSTSVFKEIKQAMETDSLMPDNNRVHVRAQAIQTDWVSAEVMSAVEAFDMFGVYHPLEEYVGEVL